MKKPDAQIIIAMSPFCFHVDRYRNDIYEIFGARRLL